MPQANDPRGTRPRHPSVPADPSSHVGHRPGPGSVDANVDRKLERFVRGLLAGDRPACRALLGDLGAAGVSPQDILSEVLWPASAMIDAWSRRDQIGAVHEECATTLLAQLTHAQLATLSPGASRGRRILVASGAKPLERLAAEIFAGLAEADGFELLFLGGGVESDDLFMAIGSTSPAFVVSYAAAGSDAARLRRLLGMLREQRPVDGLRIGVGGGVFSRAPGLADELGVDFQGDSPFDLLEALRSVAREPPRARGRTRAA